MQDQLDRIEKKVDRLDEAIRGNGGSVGINTRLDRIEQRAARAAWWQRTTLTAALAAMAGAAASMFKH